MHHPSHAGNRFIQQTQSAFRDQIGNYPHILIQKNLLPLLSPTAFDIHRITNDNWRFARITDPSLDAPIQFSVIEREGDVISSSGSDGRGI
jgi:hypothetical protein